MSKAYVAPILSAALQQFKRIVSAHAESEGKEGKRLVVFCEDRLSLVAERVLCEAVGGTFAVSVFTLSRFLTAEGGLCSNVLSSQGSAMAIRKLIEANGDKLQLFKRLSASTAAQEVYDTVALLYSSKISPDDLAGLDGGDNLLNRKLHDLELLYRAYSEYLSERGAVDRNAYLRRLPDIIRASDKIKGADVLFLGFQAFTSTVADCVRACMETADETLGIFIGGREKKYVNEAWATFVAIARELKIKGAERADFIEMPGSGLIAPAECIRKNIFEPESYQKRVNCPIVRGQLRITEAADEEEECQYIATQIIKCVKEEGVRYRDISVMFPSVGTVQPVLERVFGEYNLPMYVDRRYPLASHFACSFILDYLTCAIDGCRLESVLAVVGSPAFSLDKKCGTQQERDAFVNYVLRAASYRGGVRKSVNPDICAAEGLDYQGVERVRNAFLQGLKILPVREADGAVICSDIKKLLDFFNLKEGLSAAAELTELNGYPSVAEMSARAYGEIEAVLAEAEKLTSGEKLSVRDFAKILKSGFVSAEISLIQPKQDAVFVGDLAECANVGTKILFIGGLTDAVPAASQDTAILTDGELTSLEKLKLAVSPKISQVNRRVKEVTALNFCAFSQKLYLSYPLRSGGEECGVSEAVNYIKHLITIDGAELASAPAKSALTADENFAYYCSASAPAWRRVTFFLGGNDDINERRIAAVYKFVNGISGNALSKESAIAAEEDGSDSSEFSLLYGKAVSPTTLETYFSCPYKAFMQQGLRVSERREGAFRPLDSGNFIHAVLEGVAKKMNELKGEEQCAKEAEDIARGLLKEAAFAVQEDDGGGKYTADALVKEAVRVSLATYSQIKKSSFKVESVEQRCSLDLGGGYSVGGRIDRVDVCGDLVRIVDYKTGAIDDAPSAYYQGVKLQLPLYLSAVSEGRRPAGAYYFPANLDYSPAGGSFTLRGFMDGSADVIKSSDTGLEEKQKSEIVGAYLNGRKLDKAMPRQDFADFLSYSKLIAKSGIEQMTNGKFSPSPVKEACAHCNFKGCCGYDVSVSGERQQVSADCATVASIAKNAADASVNLGEGVGGSGGNIVGNRGGNAEDSAVQISFEGGKDDE